MLSLKVYFAVLALAGLIGLENAVTRWHGGAYSVVTVELPAGATDVAVARAIDTMRRTPGVAEAGELSMAEVAALLEPWLGAENVSETLPLPRLIDVVRREGAEVEWTAARARLSERVPEARLDTGMTWIDELAGMSRWFQGLAVAIFVLVMAVAVAAVIFATRAGLSIHRGAIEILHVLGAEDDYLARQVQRHAFVLAIRGGAVGLAAAALTVAGAGFLSDRLEAPLLPALSLGPAGWGALVAVPAVTALAAMITARVIVRQDLARLP